MLATQDKNETVCSAGVLATQARREAVRTKRMLAKNRKLKLNGKTDNEERRQTVSTDLIHCQGRRTVSTTSFYIEDKAKEEKTHNIYDKSSITYGLCSTDHSCAAQVWVLFILFIDRIYLNMDRQPRLE